MRIELSLKPEISIRQALCIEYPVVIEDIKEYFKDNESGDVRNLKELLRVVPQRQHGRLAYVVGGGWAVEVLTGKARDHGNINVLVVDPNRTSLESNRCLDYLGVHYLENALQRALIKKDVVKGRWKRGDCDVFVPSREFMIGTKMLPRTADDGNREKDISDVVQLLAVKPDVKKLAKVFNALPYIKNGESVASVVYGAAGIRRKEDVLRLLNDVLREQLAVYDGRKDKARAEQVLDLKLSNEEYFTLRKYFDKEGEGDFAVWIGNTARLLVNPKGRIYHPRHPDGELQHLHGRLSLVSALDKGVIDRDAFDVMKSSGELYAVQSSSDCLLVWNPKGKLIYESWKK